MPLRGSRAYLLLVLAAAWTLTGCGGFTINQPPNNGGVLDPVSFNVTWNTSSMNAVHFTIDGVDQLQLSQSTTQTRRRRQAFRSLQHPTL